VGTDYVTDLTYHRSFVNDLSPSRLRLVLALNGFPMPPADDFDYCELGSAHGDTIATMAAAHPGARFVGVDLNESHVEAARQLAKEGGLTNARFVAKDFEDLGDSQIPELDFIAAHGVISWVAPTKRHALLDFAAAKLKPGGALYVGYNAMPGWAAVEPLRHLLVTGAAGGGSDTAERARLGFALAKHMHDAGADYFAANPSAAAMLRRMEELGLSYIAHEYLNANWIPMYFAQLAREMAARDLYFVGQLPLYANYRDLSLPPSVKKLFESISDRATFETLKDFAVNEFFRRDVFVKGKIGRSAGSTEAYLDGAAFGLTGSLPIAEARLPYGTLSFEGPLFSALFRALDSGPATVATLTDRTGIVASDLRDALLRALLADRVTPLHAVAQPTRGLHVVSPYNQMVLRRPMESDIPCVLASPITGTGVPVSQREVLAIRSLTDVAPLDDTTSKTKVVVEAVEQFRQQRLARFLEWGILA